MNITDLITLVGIMFTFIGVLVGYFIKYLLDKRQQFVTKNSEFKRNAYSDVISLILDVMSQSTVGKISEKELVERLNGAYKLCILFASSRVILAFGDFMQYLYLNKEHDTKATMVKMTKIFKYMREDIGLSNKGLGENAEKLMRVKINDYEKYFPN